MAISSRRTDTIRVEGTKGIIANIHAKTHEQRERYRVVTRRTSQDVRDLAVQLAPKETGYMARNIKRQLTPDEMEFTVYCDPDDYLPHGLPYYPLYQEFGTSVMAAQPFLRPAYEAMEPHYLADIRAATRATFR